MQPVSFGGTSHGETTLGKLKQGTKLSDQLVSMGIGWLAREDKLSFMKEGRIVRVTLREYRAT